jgi:putative endonuclease
LAIEREKEIKNLSREKKLNMIKEINPDLEFWNYHFE